MRTKFVTHCLPSRIVFRVVIAFVALFAAVFTLEAQRATPTLLRPHAPQSAYSAALTAVARAPVLPPWALDPPRTQGRRPSDDFICHQRWPLQVAYVAGMGAAAGWIMYQVLSVIPYVRGAAIRSRLMLLGVGVGTVVTVVRCSGVVDDLPWIDVDPLPPRPDPLPRPIPGVRPPPDTVGDQHTRLNIRRLPASRLSLPTPGIDERDPLGDSRRAARTLITGQCRALRERSLGAPVQVEEIFGEPARAGIHQERRRCRAGRGTTCQVAGHAPHVLLRQPLRTGTGVLATGALAVPHNDSGVVAVGREKQDRLIRPAGRLMPRIDNRTRPRRIVEVEHRPLHRCLGTRSLDPRISRPGMIAMHGVRIGSAGSDS